MNVVFWFLPLHSFSLSNLQPLDWVLFCTDLFKLKEHGIFQVSIFSTSFGLIFFQSTPLVLYPSLDDERSVDQRKDWDEEDDGEDRSQRSQLTFGIHG
jgi:hypothetical protein